MVLHHRNQETNDIKLGVDKGQGFLKVSLSITLKLVKNDKISEKLSKCYKYAWKKFKISFYAHRSQLE